MLYAFFAAAAATAATATTPPPVVTADDCGRFGRETARCVYDLQRGRIARLTCPRRWAPAGYDADVLASDGEDYVGVLDHAPPGRYGPLTIRRRGPRTADVTVERGDWDVTVWCRR